MANNLRPASSINDLRTQAHMQLSARLESLDLTPLLIRTLGNNLPASILPYLIWELDMMIPSVPMQALGVTSQTIIQNALPLHKIMGTPGSIVQALALCGFDATLFEGQASWGGSAYPASQGWAVFRVGFTGAGMAPAGLINGTNRHFVLPETPNGNSLRVFYNGLLLRPTTDYGVSGLNLTMAFAPATNATLLIVFRSGTSIPLYFDSILPTVSGSNLTFPETPVSIELYKNGILQSGGLNASQLSALEIIVNFFKPARCLLDSVYALGGKDYSISGNTAALTVAPKSTDSFIAWGTYAGTGTAPNYADYVTPTGLVNGSNTVFTLPQSPSPAASLRLYRGWQVLKPGGVDFTLSGATITYTIAPPPTATHLAFYRY
jgi:hypothetical protein